jgi:HSP20 family molecular chaperone IbpA
MTQKAENTVENRPENQPDTAREKTREVDRYVTPAVDIYETDEGLVLLADMPGVEKDKLKVTVEDDILTIEGKVMEPLEADPEWKEYTLNSYWRQFQLNNTVDQERLSARLKNGVLTLELPKAEKAKPKQVEVKVA